MSLTEMATKPRALVAILCAIAVTVGETSANIQSAPQGSTSSPSTAVKIQPDQLDSLVAPVALYPDPLLAQVLAASTYPLEIIQLQQWLQKNKGLKDKALADAVMKEPRDPSIQALAALPEVVNRLANDISWTTDLGNAFLAQQSDVMDAVQRMRKKAQDKGNLKTTEQQKVETKVIENKSVIVVQPSAPDVVYVSSYDPVYVYGPAVYPYPPIYYPPPGYYADRIGSRDLSRSGGGNRDAFGGGSRGYNGSSARAGSNRGSSSMGSRGGNRGGGGFRGGGGRRR